MQKISNVTISYWYKELDKSPISLVRELENRLNTIFKPPFLISNMEAGYNLSMPRIETMTEDKSLLFMMSLVNANLTINNINDLDNDEFVLLINEKLQLFYDLLKEIYQVEIVYTSMKVNFTLEYDHSCNWFVDNLSLPKDDYEDFSFKKVTNVDDTYYVSVVVSTGKEVNFNITLNNNTKPLESDLFDRSMLISLQDAKVNHELLNITIEINDRLAFNNDHNYLTTKENIRGMISELKSVLKLEIDDLIIKK